MEPQTIQTNLDIREAGASRDGNPQKSDRRLFCQLHAFGACRDLNPVVDIFKKSGLEGAVYADVNDPAGFGLLILTEHPADLVERARPILAGPGFAAYALKPHLTMLGRSYSSGREQDLEDWLLHKPRRHALNPEWPWAVWYPLRRKGEFAALPGPEQGKILMEHARIGMAYGEADFAHDIRLACYGLDQNDNEFVLGLVGAELYPLSRLVQDMRKTEQTAKYIQSMGPFFVGKAVWQSPLKV